MFKVGQKVVCLPCDCGHPLCKGEWIKKDGKEVDGPKAGEILMIDFINKPTELGFNKYCTTEGFDSYYFRPVDETFAENILEEIIQEINEQELVLN